MPENSNAGGGGSGTPRSILSSPAVLEACSFLATQGLVPVGVTHPVCTTRGRGTVRVAAAQTPRPRAGPSLGSLSLAGPLDRGQLVLILGAPAFAPVWKWVVASGPGSPSCPRRGNPDPAQWFGLSALLLYLPVA